MKTNTEIMRDAKKGLKGNWGSLILVFSVLISISLLDIYLRNSTDILNNTVDKDTWMNLGKDISYQEDGILNTVITILLYNYIICFIYILITFIITPVIRLGKGRLFIMLDKEHRVHIKNIFYGFYHNFAVMIKVNIRVSINILLRSLLLIIPAILFELSVALIPFILAERDDLDTKSVMLLSDEMMFGYRWKLFCLRLRFVGWAILSILSFGIGFLWLAPYFYFSMAKFYEEVKLEHGGFPEIEAT